MKRFLFVVLTLILLVGIVGPMPANQAAHAQSNPTVESYVDMVMAHLTTWLSYSPPITRRSHFWAWSQNVYGDTALGCPDPSKAYAAVTQRGYRLVITVDGIDYDYRVAEDGSYFILCGPSGTPLYDSNTPVAAPTSAPSASVGLPPLAWFGWGYSNFSKTMYLFGPTGLITSIPHPNSGMTLIQPPRMAISPDGRYMVQREVTPAGEQVSFYNFETGELYALYGLAAGETVQLGFTSRSREFGAHSNIFNPSSTRVAVSIQGSGLGEWRVVVFDVALGTVVSQLSYLDFVASLGVADLSSAPLLQNAVNAVAGGTGYYVPNVVYYDTAGNIHLQLLPAGTEGGPYYAAMQWNPNTAIGNVSPYIYSNLDVLTPNGNMVYATVNAFMPVREPEGPYPSFNQLELGTVSGTTAVPTGLYGNTNAYLFSPQFASTDGGTIVFTPATPTDFSVFALYRNSTPPIYEELSSDTIAVLGVAGGAVALELLPSAQPNVVFAQPGGLRTTVYTPSNTLTDFGLVWVSPPGAAPGLSSVATSPRLSPTLGGAVPTVAPVVTGPVNCPGTLPSAVSVGSRARVTFTDGTPLRLRQTPGGVFIRDLAEGTPFTIIGGPSCQGGFTWWNVQLDNGTTGWSAEGDNDTYFMEPIS